MTPVQNYKKSNWFPSPKKGAGIGNASEVGKFWGSGVGVTIGGGLNFTLSDIYGDLERVGAKLEFWPSRERVRSG